MCDHQWQLREHPYIAIDQFFLDFKKNWKKYRIIPRVAPIANPGYSPSPRNSMFPHLPLPAATSRESELSYTQTSCPTLHKPSGTISFPLN